MIKASIVVADAYKNDRIFDLSNTRLNRDDCLYPFHLLKTHLEDNGIHLSTQDIIRPEDSELVIYNEMPRSKFYKNIDAKKILLLFETEAIRPDNWNIKMHKKFDIIFTWNDNFVGQGKYRKFNFSNKVPFNVQEISKRLDTKLCAMIAGNKSSNHPLELYSERLRAIEWFEREHPNDFDLYGTGWDLHTFVGFLRPLNRIAAFRRALCVQRPSYRGTVTSKFITYSMYRYAICYENIRDTPGYITEKIFDCLFAGCVPIYLGASNIADYIPRDCFIDRNNFDSYDELYDFITGMNEITYKSYVEAAIDFINEEKMIPFSAEYFANSIASAVLSLLGKRSL